MSMSKKELTIMNGLTHKLLINAAKMHAKTMLDITLYHSHMNGYGFDDDIQRKNRLYAQKYVEMIDSLNFEHKILSGGF